MNDMVGSIMFYNRNKGFGMIKSEEDKVFFFSSVHLVDKISSGDKVVFIPKNSDLSLVYSDKRQTATHIRRAQ